MSVADVGAAAFVAGAALACTAVVALRARRAPAGRRPAFVAWTLAFAIYAVAALALLRGAASGWDAPTFRAYYLFGGVLVVAYLAVGQLLLVLPGRRVSRLAAASLLFLTWAGAAAVLAAGVDERALAAAGAAPPNDALDGFWATLMAVLLNSLGTVVLVAGALWSARRRRDPRPLLVAVGVLVIALASSATRLGSYELFALAQAAGIALILAGLVLRRPEARRPSARARGL
jgi:hypothetical protein